MVSKDIARAKYVLSSWLSSMTRLKGTGSILEQQYLDDELREMGSCIVKNLASNQCLSFIQDALVTIDAKNALFSELDRRFTELGKLGQKRDRLLRKHNEQIARRERKTSVTGIGSGSVDKNTRFASPLQDAHWSYEELESELFAECDFWLQEAAQSGGVCAQELLVLKAHAARMLPPNPPAAASMPDVFENFEGWKERRVTFVAEGKQAIMQAKLLQSGNGVVEMERAEHLTIKKSDPSEIHTETPEQRSATTPPQVSNVTLSYPRVNHEQPHQPMHQQQKQQQQAPPPKVPERTPPPSEELAEMEAFAASPMSTQSSPAPYIVRWSRQFPPHVLESAEFERVRDLVASSFLVGIGKGWESYVSRTTGDNFWFCPATMEVRHENPHTSRR